MVQEDHGSREPPVGPRLSLRDSVCEQLRQLIVTGELVPGSRLVEDHLATRLQVSRNPVREALRVLAAEGFVELSPRRGAAVAHTSAERAEELFDVRMALEPLSARLAARKGLQYGICDLESVLARAEAALATSALDLLAELNTEFHSQVLELGGSHYLRLVSGPMQARTQWVFRQSVATRAAFSWAEHSAIAQAIADGDEDTAAALGQAHVAAARTSYRRLVRGGPPPLPN